MLEKAAKRLKFIKSITNASLSKDEVNLNIWCPFCKSSDRNKKKLSIHLEKCYYHCWVCDKKGSNISYIVSLINKSKCKEAESLFRTSKKKFDLFSEEIEETLKEEVKLPENFSFLVENYNTQDPDSRDVLKYAIKRGFNKHKLYLLRPGFSTSYDFSRYLILPSYDKNGDLNYYTARKIDADTHNSFKYKNATVSKSNIIFNEINIDWNRELTIVEGPLDLIKTNDNATCLLGSSLTEDMLLFQEIVKNKTKVKLALDSDIFYKTLKIANLLSSYDISVDILDTRGFEDVGAMTHEAFKSVFKNSKQYNSNDNLLNKIRNL